MKLTRIAALSIAAVLATLTLAAPAQAARMPVQPTSTIWVSPGK